MKLIELKSPQYYALSSLSKELQNISDDLIKEIDSLDPTVAYGLKFQAFKIAGYAAFAEHMKDEE